ncbi:serine hydrolase [Microtetraspora sp. NBRC 13810]|uniref:serine hydrolase domain-containing protein n=1 Tax=Microtetraspora sp. NBRC 13810 TaxID=3030990 RepID=UPI0024A2FD88|nr:serine hydrolase domain-containing protein [Microtetraspora sp. NBRC 13810]GLW13077.1 serine hydrolase [Microtetraspora sp. NBRC 13810]
MSELDAIGTWLRENLPRLLDETQVPGAAVAVSAGDETIDFAAGVLNKATGVEATTDSLFQIGSITKVWTATLIMQLVDEGLADLDSPVRGYLPEFRLADEDAASRITVRQLLCHTSGFEGDIFTDTGTGDDCVEKYVATLADVAQLFTPGEMFSYNNAGYSVLGRIVEVLRGKSYDECLREHLFLPLGLTHAATSPYDAIRYRAAIGHLQPAPGAAPEPAPVWALARSNAPAGAMLAMRPRDLLTFVRMHLRDGAGPDGATVLSKASVPAMREPQVNLPHLGLMGDAWGIGWEIFHSAGGTVIGHDGGTIGQSSFLRVVPDRDVSVALFTNGGEAIQLYTEILGKVLADLAGVTLPPLPTPGPTPTDVSRYLGTYSSDIADTEISQDDDGRVWLHRRAKGVLAQLGPATEKIELAGLHDDTLVTKTPLHGLHLPHAFVGDDGTGRALFLHTGRADRRTGA